MPPLPEAHTYVETKTFTRVNNSYKKSREDYAKQKQDSEAALISISLKSVASNSVSGLGKVQTLFHCDPDQFHLIPPDERSSTQSLQAIMESTTSPPFRNLKWDASIHVWTILFVTEKLLLALFQRIRRRCFPDQLFAVFRKCFCQEIEPTQLFFT